jgi:hypothetical protein
MRALPRSKRLESAMLENSTFSYCIRSGTGSNAQSPWSQDDQVLGYGTSGSYLCGRTVSG